MSDSNLNYKINGDASGIKKSLSEALEGTKKLEEGIKGAAEAFGLLFLAEKGLEFIKDSLKESFNAFKENETAAHDLARAVGASGGLVGDFKELQNQASELAEKGIFSKKDIERAEAMQLQLGLTAEQVKKLTPLAADMAAGFMNKSGEKLSVEAMTGEIDKYLRTGKSKVLAQLGVTGGNTLAERQALLAKGGEEFKGRNQDAALNTTEGKLANLGNKWEEIQAGIGSKLADLFTAALPYIDMFIGGLHEIGDWFDNHSEAISSVFSKIGNWIEPFVGLFKSSFSEVSNIVTGLWDDIVKISEPIMDLLNFLKPYFIEFETAVISFGGTLFNLFQRVFNIGFSIYQILDKLGLFSVLGKIFNAVWSVLKDIGNSLTWLYNNIISPILTKFETALNALKQVMKIKDEPNNPLAEVFQPNSTATKDNTGLNGVTFGGGKTTPSLNALAPTEKESTRESITLNIDKLVETLELNTTNLTEGASEIKKMVAQALQEAVYSVKYAGH